MPPPGPSQPWQRFGGSLPSLCDQKALEALEPGSGGSEAVQGNPGAGRPAGPPLAVVGP